MLTTEPFSLFASAVAWAGAEVAGWVVVPPRLVAVLSSVRSLVDGCPAVAGAWQLSYVVAPFMAEAVVS